MKKYYLSVCAIVHNEGPYIQEWIEFNLIQGVQHFYIYCHDCTDDTVEILKKYRGLGLVTFHKAHGDAPQHPCYQSCLEIYRKESQWIAFIDVDEFLYAKGTEVHSALQTYEDHGALAVNWILYGSAGHEKQKPGLVIERFAFRGLDPDKHVKSIVQTDYGIHIGNNAHYFLLERPAVNELRQELPKEYYWTDPSVEVFRIHHYHTKSKEEYWKRKAERLDVDGVERGVIEERFRAHDVNNVFDPMPFELVKQTKDAVVLRNESWS